MTEVYEYDGSGEDNESLDAKIKELELQKARAKTEKKTKEELRRNAAAYRAAKKIYDQYGLSFHRDSQPRYFYKLMTSKTDKKGSVIRMQDIQYFSHSSLYPNFSELESEMSRRYLRQMIEGSTISYQEPDGQFVQETFQRRVYDKMTNTVHQVDEKTYNLVDLSDRLMPQEVEIAECPVIIKALLYAITGNQIRWDEEARCWQCDKPDTLEWFEKWLYGAVYANIGDFSMSMPVIFGDGKVGKNALCDIVIRQILGTWCCFTGTWDVIDSNFTAFKLGKTFVFIDEIPERSEWTKLKNATGSNVQYIKEKYGPEFEVDNCIVFMMGSNNHTFPLPWEDGEQMMRVSPIKTSRLSTFAGNAVKMLNQHYSDAFPEPFVDAIIRESGNDPAGMTEFQKGDYVLRHLLSSEWQGQECAQQFLNYLHKKFSGSIYQLSPLRSTDWENIKETKINGIEVVTEFVLAHDPDIITVTELYEIYREVMADPMKCKNKPNFTSEIKESLTAEGYEYKHSATLRENVRDNAFVKPNIERGQQSRHSFDFDRYLRSETVNGRHMRHLIWPADTASDFYATDRMGEKIKGLKKNWSVFDQ